MVYQLIAMGHVSLEIVSGGVMLVCREPSDLLQRWLIDVPPLLHQAL